MDGLRILYFSDSLLYDSELLPTENVVEAAKHASSRSPHLTAEIWSGARKLAVIRPSSIMHGHSFHRAQPHRA